MLCLPLHVSNCLRHALIRKQTSIVDAMQLHGKQDIYSSVEASVRLIEHLHDSFDANLFRLMCKKNLNCFVQVLYNIYITFDLRFNYRLGACDKSWLFLKTVDLLLKMKNCRIVLDFDIYLNRRMILRFWQKYCNSMNFLGLNIYEVDNNSNLWNAFQTTKN